MRFYSTPSWRLARQVSLDVGVLAWIALWAVAGRVTDGVIRALAGPARQSSTTLDALRGHLVEAGARAGDVPLVGTGLSRPFLDMAAELERLAASTEGLAASLDLVAVVLGWLVFLGPAVPVLALWIPLRISHARRARDTAALTATAEGRDLLALRALATRPVAELRTVASDPAAAWRAGDQEVTGRLAELELAAAGVRVPADAPWRTPTSPGDPGAAS